MSKSRQIYGPLHSQMAEEEKAIHYKRRFYSGDKDFSSFENVDSNMTDKVDRVSVSLFPESQYPKHSSKRYFAVLNFLMNSKNNKEFTSFDEKIVFLIRTIDPDLSVYFFLLSNGFSIHDENSVKRQRCRELISFITRSIGILDTQFLKYEELYYFKFLKSSEFISNVNRDYSSVLFGTFKAVIEHDALRDISDTQFQMIVRKADYYLENCENPRGINTVCFNMNNPNSPLELWNSLYKIIFFILVVDSDLRALTIYAEESNMEKIKERMMNELGFFHEDFIKIEELYRKRFFPGLRVSEWNL